MTNDERFQVVTPDKDKEAEKTRTWLQRVSESMRDFGSAKASVGLVVLIMLVIYIVYVLITGNVPR